MNYGHKIYDIFQKKCPNHWIGRLDTAFEAYEVDNHFILSTVTDKVSVNSYVASPYSLIIDYSKSEVVKIDSKMQRFFSKSLIYFFASFLKYTNIDKMQTLNNYLLSTNFFSSVWEDLSIENLEALAIARYPKHGLIVRSVNKYQNPKLFENLKKRAWVPIVSRQVYLFSDKAKWRKSRNTINDKKLLEETGFSFIKIKADEKDFSLFEQSEVLYNALYLEKYSPYNIQFKAAYLQQLVQKELLFLYLLKDMRTMKYVGVLGMTEEENCMTVPLVGYDRSYALNVALYRRLIAFATSYAMSYDLLLNLSSGAPYFKTFRGAKAELEYMFVKVEHLSFRRKVGWYFIAFVSKYFYAPLLRKYKL